MKERQVRRKKVERSIGGNCIKEEYSKPDIKTIRVSAPPLAANFAPPPVGKVGQDPQEEARPVDEEKTDNCESTKGQIG